MSTQQPQTGIFGLVRRFLAFVVSIIKGYLISVGLVVTVLPILLMVLASQMSSTIDTEQDAAISKAGPKIVEIRIDGPIAESEPSMMSFLGFFENRDSVYLPEIRATLRRAAKDKDIKGLYLDFANISGSAAEFAEFRRLLAQFKSSEKPIFAFLPQASTYDYYLASVADNIAMPPTAELSLTGPVFQLAYFADALSKLGVQFEVVRAGKYKSAMEPMILNAPTPETTEMYRAMESSLRQHIVDAVATSRNKSPAVVSQWFKQSIFSTQGAANAGIFDAVMHLEEHRAALKKQLDTEDFVSWQSYLKRSDKIDESDADSGKDGIALIEAMGEIHVTDPSQGAEENINVEQMRKQFKWAREAKDVKAVVLRVSSPGGSATASEMIWHEAAALAAAKPLIVSMGQYAASGGYYIAAPATKILAEATTITGSIGVIGGLMNLSGFKDKWGVHFHNVTQSDRAKMLNPGDKPSPADRQLLEATIDDVYATFVQRVADGRKLDVEQVKQLAQGRVYTGAEALDIKLVDQLGGLTEAIQVAKELAGLDPQKLYPMLRFKEKSVSLSECLRNPLKMMQCLDQLETSINLPAWSAPSAITQSRDGERVLAKIKRLISSAQDNRILAVWPGYFFATSY